MRQKKKKKKISLRLWRCCWYEETDTKLALLKCLADGEVSFWRRP
ncbi:hypothetical protein OK016_08180 [Vibrio chagasii]|nr:hypothetical protein [Vibrio chagasii]